MSKKETKQCETCGNEFSGLKWQKYCSSQCYRSGYNKKVINSGLVQLPTNTIGAIAELIVSLDLLKKGFDVFRSLSPSSDADIVAIKAGNIYLIEVRTGYYYSMASGEQKVVYSTARANSKIIVIFTHSDNKIHYVNANGVFD